MKCHGCSSLMVLDKQEFGEGSCTQWHSCPLCSKVRLTSQPTSPTHHEDDTVVASSHSSDTSSYPNNQQQAVSYSRYSFT